MTFKKFKSSIRACQKYERNEQDVCHNRNMCWKNQKKIDCKCSGKLSHQCGDGYCAVNRDGCEMLRKTEIRTKKIKIKECKAEKNHSFSDRLILFFYNSFRG